MADPGAFVLALAAAGLAAGSFVTVVVHRLPLMLEAAWRREAAELTGAPPPPEERLSLAAPRSHCPRCARPVPWRGLVPLAGFVLLRGRCAGCGAPIPLHYPLVELLCAAGAAACAWRFGPGWAALGASALTCALVALAAIDLKHRLLPDAITLPTLWAGLGFNLALAGGGTAFAALPSAVLGAMGGYGALWLAQRGYRLLRGREGLGSGDLKLTAMLGAWLGWEALPGVVFLAAAAGAAAGLLAGKGNAPIAFGPWLALAGWLALVAGGNAGGGFLPFLP